MVFVPSRAETKTENAKGPWNLLSALRYEDKTSISLVKLLFKAFACSLMWIDGVQVVAETVSLAESIGVTETVGVTETIPVAETTGNWYNDV